MKKNEKKTTLHKTTLHKTKFTIELGTGLASIKANIDIYAIKSGRPLLIESKSVTKEKFSVSLHLAQYKYFYALTTLEQVEVGISKKKKKVKNMQLLSVFDSNSKSVIVSEQVTVAATYCFSRFIKFNTKGDISIVAKDRQAAICYGMKNNFVSTSGKISKVISSSPNGLETNSYPLFNFVSNILYYSIANDKVYKEFLDLTDCKSGLLEGLFNLARNPFKNNEKVYALVEKKKPVFKPSLQNLKLPKGHSPIPNHWSLAIKVNDSGSRNFLMGGPAYIAWDKNDRAWIANNVRQGSPNSGSCVVVLNSDGSPAPFSPVRGGGVLGTGFGIVANKKGDKIFTTNYGWGPKQYNPQFGSLSIFTSDGTPLSPTDGYTTGITRGQGLKFDRKGNLWISSWGSQIPMAPTNDNVFNFKHSKSAVVVYLNGDPKRVITYEFDSPFHGTFDVVFDSEDNAIVSCGGHAPSKKPPIKKVVSAVHKFKIEKNKIVHLAQWKSKFIHKGEPIKTGQEFLKQININSKDEIFVCGVSSGRVVKLSKNLKYKGAFTTNINAPWGVTIDKKDTMYVSNFGKPGKSGKLKDSLDMNGKFGMTIITNQDDTNSQFMNLPTGGHPVMLNNGFPLYGDKFPLSYQPMMRSTGSVIDKAGNIWWCNNWKPSAYEDLLENPGGDGIIIFVGVAEPN